MSPSVAQFTGCLLGLALGDAMGAPYEGGPLERMLWRLLGTTRAGERRYTDDTTMSLALAESLIARGGIDQDDLAARFAAGYRWSRGYGPGAAKVLRRIRAGAPWRDASRSVYPSGSFGNGGAMRAPVVALWTCHRASTLRAVAEQSAEVTHAHPLGMEGAVAVASATLAALEGRDARAIVDGAARSVASRAFTDKFALAAEWLESGGAPGAREVRDRLGSGMLATESCVTAVYVAARFADAPFAELLAFAAACGGDVDTVSAMAGAVWGARRGMEALPEAALARLEDRARIERVATALHDAAPR